MIPPRPAPPRTLALLLASALALLGAGAAAAAAAHASAGTRRIVVSGVRGKRYCELLLVHGAAKGLVADVYNSFGHNTCPPASWRAIDTAAVAKANHAIVAVRNGPRFWLMDTIVKLHHGPDVVKRFGALSMTKEATVTVGALSAKPFTIHTVDRATEFDFARGHTVYELVGPHVQVWVMQSWSAQIEPGLRQSGLTHLSPRLTLPAGWHYRVRRLTRPLRVVTVRTAAQVLQDNLDDTYSRIR